MYISHSSGSSASKKRNTDHSPLVSAVRRRGNSSRDGDMNLIIPAPNAKHQARLEAGAQRTL
jgi:hypothetical protein